VGNSSIKSRFKKKKGEVAQVVEHLPSKCEAPVPPKRGKKAKRL
jgi:hypothetical protein